VDRAEGEGGRQQKAEQCPAQHVLEPRSWELGDEPRGHLARRRQGEEEGEDPFPKVESADRPRALLGQLDAQLGHEGSEGAGEPEPQPAGRGGQVRRGCRGQGTDAGTASEGLWPARRESEAAPAAR